MKKSLCYLSFTCLLFFLLLFPKTAASSARTGLMLWFNTLLPSMLPFMILSGLLIRSGFLEKLLSFTGNFWKKVFGLTPMGGYGLLTGIFCGYPMGAKTAADLYRSQYITRQEASYLLAFSSHPGPAFLSSYLCTELLHREDLIPAAYGILYLSSFLTSLIFRPFYHFSGTSVQASPKKEVSRNFSWGEALDTSIMDSFLGITRLGGYILLFSLLQGILEVLPYLPVDLKALLLGFTEITTGTSALAQRPWDWSVTFPLLLAAAASGGLCIAFQTRSMLNETDLSLAPYLKGKVCTFFITLILGILFVKVLKIIV